jgi:lathosterol oxidase
MLDWLWSMSVAEATGFFFALNILIVSGAYCLECIVPRFFKTAPQNLQHSSLELLLMTCTVFVNALISVAGWLLWKYGHLQLNRHADGVTIVRDTLAARARSWILYSICLHRIAHMRWFYNWAHYLHHEHRDVRPCSRCS